MITELGVGTLQATNDRWSVNALEHAITPGARIALSRDGSRLFVTRDGALSVLDLAHDGVTLFEDDTLGVHDYDLSDDGSMMVCSYGAARSSGARALMVIDVNRGLERTLDVASVDVGAVKFLPSLDAALLCGRNDGLLRLISLSDGRCIASSKISESGASELVLDPHRLFGAVSDGTEITVIGPFTSAESALRTHDRTLLMPLARTEQASPSLRAITTDRKYFLLSYPSGIGWWSEAHVVAMGVEQYRCIHAIGDEGRAMLVEDLDGAVLLLVEGKEPYALDVDALALRTSACAITGDGRRIVLSTEHETKILTRAA